MRRKTSRNELNAIYFLKKEYILILSILLLYSFYLLRETLIKKGNLADFLLSVTDFHALFYCISPIFLIAITSFFSVGHIQNYLIVRFKSKKAWYTHNVVLISKFVTVFCILLIAVMILESLLVLDINNKWSEYAIHFYSFHHELLVNFKPLILIITTVLLLWLFLFFSGLLYYVVFLITGKIFISFLFLFALNSINIVGRLSQLENISYYLFYNRINVFQYIYMTHSDRVDYPFGIFFYWAFLIMIIYIAGYLVINKLDMDITKGKES
ncbi:hypothetical protein ACQKMD_21450 [Viridibacillus sp. NPDC096237]|uniref:hypothetical protein n=1 Tax=Viridibacillus sp. NPDC096237 TaxID=3390721 RepID=UPI003D01BD71